MNNSIVRKLTPEEQELERKKIELGSLEFELAQSELDLATFQAELRAFELRYLRTVGVKYAELDRINAEGAELLARLNPQDSDAQKRAEQATDRADESARETGEATSSKSTDHFEAPEDLKKLFRDAAKKIHPDLALDDHERQRRTRVMAEINMAYQEGDAEKIRSILDEWEGRADAIKGEGIGAELIRIIRKIAQVQERLQKISIQLNSLKESELFKLMRKVDEAEKAGIDLLAEMSAEVEKEIAEAKEHLSRLRAQAN